LNKPTEVKKRGKVIILRLKRKVYEPERKPNIKRSLRRLNESIRRRCAEKHIGH